MIMDDVSYYIERSKILKLTMTKKLKNELTSVEEKSKKMSIGLKLKHSLEGQSSFAQTH